MSYPSYHATSHATFATDYRNADVRDYVARQVLLNAAAGIDAVDGMFTDDPGGLGAEHNAVAHAVQLSASEVSAVQLGAQQSWMAGLALLTRAKKYIPQAYRTTPPLFTLNGTAAGAASCMAWMRRQCAIPANESTVTYPASNPPSVGVAAFLVSRGPFSYVGVNQALIDTADWNDPNFRLFRLDTGKPTSDCTEASPGVFTRAWSGGQATLDCTATSAAAAATLDFQLLPQPELH